MNKQTIITILLALVTMTGLAQTKTATVTGYSPALKDGTLVLAAVLRRITSKKLIRGWNACANLAFA